ncbi:BAH and coiled-coil domain-containing protein 1-like [Polyodon spathula]|uniref:BAH and coiled-coil domain-containing protein 1-like n=1 Tax=Polyodon spathula TaxID=7913 RepID=UPI001B7DCFE9|nr:BAH and coiled-coil domain-containing protein 1-like [Polyodon spathula]
MRAELLTFDLQRLATLAAARSLELGPSSPVPGRPCHVRRAFNLRRECSWTPRHEPVCPVKGAMDRMDSQEVEMRMRLADLQRQYKEKQRELAKLQRRHDHQKEEKSRSPARRGPGRPRKRKPAPGTVNTPGEGARRVKSLGAGLGLLCEELGGEVKRKKNKLSEFERLGTSQVKARCKQPGTQVALSSKQARKASQLKQNAKVQRRGSGGTPFRRRETHTPSSAPPRLSRGQGTPRAEQKRVAESRTQTDTGVSMDNVAQESWAERETFEMKRSGRKDGASLTRTTSATASHQPPRRPVARGRGRPGSRQPKQEMVTEKETSRSESESSEEEEEDEWSYDNDEDVDDIIAPPAKDPTPSTALLGPSPSSVVKLEANQKAKKKKERQGLLGSLQLPVAEGGEGEVKVRKRTPSRLEKRRNESRERDGEKRAKGLRQQQQEQGWTDPSARSSLYRASPRVHPSSTPSERLRKATRKNKTLQGSSKQKKSSVLGGALYPRRLECVSSKGKNNSNFRRKPLKGRAVSRLLESFAADEGFQIDEDSSFSEEEEEEEEEDGNKSAPLCSPRDRSSTPTVPNCTLTKESLVDGLKVLILKEDDLLYAAYIHTLQPPDIYSIMIEGERGNRPRIYSLEQLLQEAVLDVRPQTEQELTSGTRVCAYWSERSRCLYPGYVRRGGPGEEEKEGSVMVEFDDGDSGQISLSNIRLLPPDYQIQSTEPPSAMLLSNGRRRCRKAAVEKTVQGYSTQRASPERQSHTEPGKTQGRRTASKGKTGNEKTANSGTKSTAPGSLCKSSSSSPLLSWPGVALPKKRMPHKMSMGLQNLFQLNGNPRKISKSKETCSGGFTLHPLSTPPSTSAKTIFSSSFEVDSFSSIANGYSSFGSQAGLPLSPRNNTSSRGKRQSYDGGQRGRKASKGAEFLVKLDHEGVTSPKTKNGKALLLLGSTGSNGRVEKGFGAKEVVVVDASPVGYTHPVLLVKDNKKGGGSRADLLLKGAGQLCKPPASSLGLGEYSEFGMNCDSDCHSSYSDMDEEDDEEDDERNTRLRNAGRFLSQLSVSSTSSVSSSSSSSGSLSSSSLCSSDNDSSYSSEDEEDSTLLLQSCLSSHPSVPTALLQPPEPPANAGSFVAKAMTVSNSKPLKRKESPSSSSKTAKDLAKRQRLLSVDNGPKISNFLPARQLWRWSGNPTQRRGMKGKARKLFYKAIVRGKEAVHVGDCAVFLSAGRPHLPYIGRIESFWESWASNMVVKVKWFYHPEETKLGKRHRDGRHALYQSCHEDENDVQTISHKCQVVTLEEYECLSQGRKHHNGQDLYYLAGTYDPTTGQLVTAQGVSILC